MSCPSRHEALGNRGPFVYTGVACFVRPVVLLWWTRGLGLENGRYKRYGEHTVSQSLKAKDATDLLGVRGHVQSIVAQILMIDVAGIAVEGRASLRAAVGAATYSLNGTTDRPARP